MSNALEVKDLSKRFKSFSVNNIAFSLPTGRIMGLIGKNGAGKTTTIKLILNMISKDSGVVKVFGKDNISHEKEIKERIGVVMDNVFYADEWTVLTVAKALSPFYKNWDNEKYIKALSDFSIKPNKKVGELSRGMKMKLMIAVALSHNADLLILDEPTSGLDPVARNDLMEILKEYIEEGNKSILFSTHITSDLEKIADYITFMNNGSVAYSNTKSKLMEKYITVKGNINTLTNEQKNIIIGYREHNTQFKGIIESEAIRTLPSTIITENSNLDEIIIRFNMAGGKPHE